MKNYVLYFLTISFLFLILIYSDNKRDKYESFLLSKYQTIPNHTKEELENIPKPEHPHLATFQNFFMSLDPVLGYVPSERLTEHLMETRNIQRESLIVAQLIGRVYHQTWVAEQEQLCLTQMIHQIIRYGQLE